MKKWFSVLLLFFFISFYGQNDTLSVVRHTDNDLIVPKTEKIVFRGIKNELIITVPNCKSYAATGDYLKHISGNLYDLFPRAGKETLITIKIVLKNNKTLTETHRFRIQNINHVVTCFNYIKADSIIRVQKHQFKNAIIRIISGNKNLDFKFKVRKFSVKIPGQPPIVMDGDQIDERAFDKINRNATFGDQIVICDISVSTGFVGCILISPMVLEIY